MKKKLLIIMLATTFALTGCGNAESSTSETVETEQEAVESTDVEDAETEETASAESVEITLENVMSAPESPEEDFETRNYDGNEGVVIEAYIGDDEIVVIPSQIDGKDVVMLDGWQDSESTVTVKGVVIPDTVFQISSMVFAQNETIEIVVLGSGVKIIEEYAFFSASHLSELILPEGLETIGKSAISGNAMETLEVPSSVTDLGDGAILDTTIIAEEGTIMEAYAEETFNAEFQAK